MQRHVTILKKLKDSKTRNNPKIGPRNAGLFNNTVQLCTVLYLDVCNSLETVNCDFATHLSETHATSDLN